MKNAKDMLFVLGPFLAVGVCLILADPFFTNWIIAGCYALGLVLLLIAKSSLFRKGTQASAGTEKPDSQNRKIYRQAYVMLGVGLLINIFAIAIRT